MKTIGKHDADTCRRRDGNVEKPMMRHRPIWAKRIQLAGWLLMAVLLPMLAGCAALEGLRAPGAAARTAAAAHSPGVAPLEDDREGFVIREVPAMDEGASRQFAHAVALLHDRDYAQAAELLEKVVAGGPGVTAPHINLAIAYIRLGRPEAAEAHLQTALAMVPGHPLASNTYGLLCRKAGRFEAAREIYEASLERFPDYAPVRRNLAILCDLYLNDLESALEHYERYSQDRPQEAEVRLWIADLRNRLGTELGSIQK